MMKNRKFDEQGFFDRLLEVLKTEKQTWWAKETGTSQSMVSNYWYKRKYPRSDKISRILELKGISANWLFFNIGPRDLVDLDESEVEKKQNVDRRTQVEIVALADENIRLKEKIVEYEIALKQSDLLEYKVDSGGHIPADKLTGAFSFARLLMDIIIKMADKYAEDNVDNDKLSAILDWVIQNRDSKKRDTEIMLQDMDSVIN